MQGPAAIDVVVDEFLSDPLGGGLVGGESDVSVEGAFAGGTVVGPVDHVGG